MTHETGGQGSRRRLPLAEVAALAVLVILAGVFLVPTLKRQRTGNHLMHCTSNLKQIYTFAMAYSDQTGRHSFPLAPGLSPRAHESLNLMIAFDAEGLHPAMFTCREGEAVQAAQGSNGNFTLTEGTLDYSWISKPTKNTAANLPLASDKYVSGYRDAAGTHSGHKGGLNVLMTDNRVVFVPAAELPSGTLLPAGLTR